MNTHANDPALKAAEEVRTAEDAVLGLAINSAVDELRSDFVEAEARWDAADERFADAIPTTAEGVLAKLKAVHELQRGMPRYNLEVRHVRALIDYFEKALRGRLV